MKNKQNLQDNNPLIMVGIFLKKILFSMMSSLENVHIPSVVLNWKMTLENWMK
jgi:hypothetical protein